mgnify:CR=1 FL=1
MKYRITLNGTVYEVEVENGEAAILTEYAEGAAPAVPAEASEPAQPATLTVELK